MVLLVPACAVLIFVSMQTGFSHHLRYVLPIAPFTFIWMSKLAHVFGSEGRDTLTPDGSHEEIGVPRQTWLMRCAVAGALGWSVISSLSVYPHTLSYFNELAGGPKGGHWHLGNSNVDWGQDLFYLKDWYDEHPEARPLQLAYDLALVDRRFLALIMRRCRLAQL